MALSRFVVIEVYEGEEDVLRSRYALSIRTGGVWMNADGVKQAYLPVSAADVSGIKDFDDAMDRMRKMRGTKVELEKV